MGRSSRGDRILWGQRGLGAALVLLASVPIYRLTRAAEGGLAGRATAEIVATQAAFLWNGALILALLAGVAGVLLSERAWERPVRWVGRWLNVLSPGRFAFLLAGLGFVATLVFTLAVLDGKPNLVDAMVQLTQARFWVGGRLAGPTEGIEFWFVQNTVLTPEGWVSQYPPGHLALLAAGLGVGAVEVVGPILMAVTGALTYLSLRRLLGRETVARLAGLGVALSPFLISHAGSYMSHGSAAALSVLAVYLALRARDGAAVWGLALGAALGLLVTNRPVFALGIAFGVVAPLAAAAVFDGRLTGGAAARRVGLAVLGGAPFLGLLLAYNAHFFGGPLELGYVAAWGDAHALGFHRDPWGNLYTPLAALAYTSADLTALSLSLFETPLPVVPLIGVWLLFTDRLRAGEWVVVAWALIPVVINAFYWHHSYFMGPRMLAEAVPGWAALAVLALAGLVRWVPESLGGSGGSESVRFRPRTALVGALVVAALGALWLAPLRLVNRGGDFHPSLRLEPPSPDEHPALVFVHGGWSDRVFARLAAEGLTMLELEAAIRQNDLCDLELALERSASGPLDTSMLDLDPRPTLPGLIDVEVFPNNTITVRRDRVGAGGLELPAPCRRQLLSDREGIYDVAPLLWRGELPGTGRTGTLYARDLGPAANATLLSRYPRRVPYLLVREGPGGPLSLRPYDQGMARVWSPGDH